MKTDIFNILKQHNLHTSSESYLQQLNNITCDQVERELSVQPGNFSLDRLIKFISPAAKKYIEEMAAQAQQLTIQRFGRTIGLYAPLYVSNYCLNSCKYCGFSCKTKMERTRLSVDQAIKNADIIAAEGFRNILIVSGEDPKYITTAYLKDLAERLRSKFATISIEIQPLSQQDYKACFNAGIDGVTLYQETYNQKVYEFYHPAGPKACYKSRLQAHDRTASASMRRLGLGFLIGLSNWQVETLAMAIHAKYLMKKYWQSQISFSFPRLRPTAGKTSQYKHLISDLEMVQMICALRLCFADAGIVLSTREPADFRDNMARICVTQMSAGSKTNPNGYTENSNSLKQFEIDDTRSPAEVSSVIKSLGYEPVYKDWDKSFSQ